MSPSPLVQVRQGQLWHGDQLLHLCGVNLGNWMLVESYMLGLPWTEFEMRRQMRARLGEERFRAFWETFEDSGITEADVVFLKESGLNLLQVPFNYRHFADPAEDRTALGFSGRGFLLLDRLRGWCARHGLYLLLGMHAAPGAQVRDWNAESNYGEAGFWEHRFFQRQTAEIWRAIAARYRGDPVILGYELVNEPVAPDLDLFHRINLDLLRAVREVDPDHLVVVNSNRWGKEIASLREELFEDPQVIPSLHHYHHQFPPFDRLTAYPGTWEGRSYGRSELLATLAGTHDRARLGRPHLVGECGVPHRWPGFHAEALLDMWDDLLGHFNEEGLHWTFWDYKDQGAIGLLAPRPETAWQRWLLEGRWLERQTAWHRLSEDLAARLAEVEPGLAEEDRKLAAGQCQHWLDAVSLPLAVERLAGCDAPQLATLARSFALENCTAHPRLLEIVRRRAAAARGRPQVGESPR